MITEVVGTPKAAFQWIDVVEPTLAELEGLATNFNLHGATLQACLEPDHQPKFEKIGNVCFVILRAIDENAGPRAIAVQQLTRKLAIFIGESFILTVHRLDQPFIAKIRQHWQTTPGSLAQLIHDLVRGVLDSYERPLEKLQEEVSTLEMRVFQGSAGAGLIHEGYLIRRKAAVYQHMLGLASDVLADFSALPQVNGPNLRRLKDKAHRLRYYADDLKESIDNVLNLHIALGAQKTNEASQRTNEVMRLLTVFSAFFLPLNFIASIYGMNFENMPELKTPNGYFVILGIMVLVAGGILAWFRSRGWLKG